MVGRSVLNATSKGNLFWPQDISGICAISSLRGSSFFLEKFVDEKPGSHATVVTVLSKCGYLQIHLALNFLSFLIRGVIRLSFANLETRRVEFGQYLSIVFSVCNSDNEVRRALKVGGFSPPGLMNSLEIDNPPNKIDVYIQMMSHRSVR